MVAQRRKRLIGVVASVALVANLVWLTWIVQNRQRPNPMTSDMGAPTSLLMFRFSVDASMTT